MSQRDWEKGQYHIVHDVVQQNTHFWLAGSCSCSSNGRKERKGERKFTHSDSVWLDLMHQNYLYGKLCYKKYLHFLSQKKKEKKLKTRVFLLGGEGGKINQQDFNVDLLFSCWNPKLLEK